MVIIAASVTALALLLAVVVGAIVFGQKRRRQPPPQSDELPQRTRETAFVSVRPTANASSQYDDVSNVRAALASQEHHYDDVDEVLHR